MSPFKQAICTLEGPKLAAMSLSGRRGRRISPLDPKEPVARGS